MEPQAYDKPLPNPDLDTKPFWDGLKNHKLMLQQCGGCGRIRHYPRPVCDNCYSMAVDWLEASGQGTLHSWTITHHAFLPGFKQDLPLLLATVDLAEGVRMNCQLKGVDPAELELGLPVKVAYEAATDEVTLPIFVAAQ